MSIKKFLLIGLVLMLLVGIPLTIYYIQQQQEVRTRAQKSTVLSFAPESSQVNPISKKIDDQIALDVMVNPGVNLVSFVKLQILYDSDKLSIPSTGGFVPNTIVFPTVLEGPIFSPGKVEVTLSVGPDPTKAVQSLAKAGTVNFVALANTPEGQPTLVTYGPATQVLSIGSTDQASENVLSSSLPATIVISGAEVTPTPGGPTTTPAPTPDGTSTPTPTTGLTQPTATPIPTESATPTPSPTLTPTPTGSGNGELNQSPVCSNLAVDRATTGLAPFAITFTANGSDADGIISKVNFNFGDGAVSGDITTSGGIGTNTVNVSISHEYVNPGTFTASAVLTDDRGDTSSPITCEQTIIVQSGATPTTPQAIAPTFTPTPTMAPTGSLEIALGVGMVALLLLIGGGLLFFML